MSIHEKSQSLVNKFFTDKDGHVVILQPPNLPITGWFVSLVISYFVSGKLKTSISHLSTAFLFTWAYLEITEGSSYFRRFVGVIVMITVLVGLVL